MNQMNPHQCRHTTTDGEKTQTWDPGDPKEASSFDSKYAPSSGGVAPLAITCGYYIGLRTQPIIFLGRGGCRDSERQLRYLLVAGKAWSRKGFLSQDWNTIQNIPMSSRSPFSILNKLWGSTQSRDTSGVRWQVSEVGELLFNLLIRSAQLFFIDLNSSHAN